MNDIVQTGRNSLALSRGTRGFSVVPTNFGEVVDFAKDMCRAETAIPKHLRGNPGACMAVALQAFEWGMSPFAVANKSYSVNDRIAYEAQLIAAVVNTRSGIIGRLKYEFTGSGQELRCKVSGKFVDGDAEYQSPRLGDIKPQNSPLWKTDPEQQLGYYSARAWARRHVPETILGVYDREEVEADFEAVTKTSAPPPPPVELETIEQKPKATRKAKAAPVEEAQIVEPVEEEGKAPPTPPPAPTAEDGDDITEIAKELEEAMGNAATAADAHEIWEEFDLLARFTNDEESQEFFSKIYNRIMGQFESKPSKMFSDH